MKIAIVTLQFEETATGGGGVHVKNICDQFLKQGQEITVISIHTNKTLRNDIELKQWKVPYNTEKRDGLTLVRFLIDKDIEQPYAGDKDVELDRIKRFADTVIDWLKDSGQKFDVINLHGHHIIPGYMAKELQEYEAKVISTSHALETTYMSKNGEFIGAFEGTSEVLAKIRKWEAMCRYADHIIVNSPLVHDDFLEIVREFDKNAEKYNEKIVLISSGCTSNFLMDDDCVKEKLNNAPECINLVTFCRIDPSKGVEFSINGAKAAARLSSYKFCLTIAGIPSSEEYIEQLKTETENIPDNLKIEFKLLDTISPVEEKKEILDDKHMYILPTLKEPFGMSVIEASARGNMIVSADTNGPQFMFESDSGQKVDWGTITDYGVLADITEDHCSRFPENIGKAIVWTRDNWQIGVDHVLKFNKKIRDTWTWEGIAKQYMDLFENEKTIV